MKWVRNLEVIFRLNLQSKTCLVWIKHEWRYVLNLKMQKNIACLILVGD